MINRLRMTEQTAHMLGTEINTRLFPPIAEDNNEHWIMMTQSNGNIFRVTGPLCGEFTGHR